MSDSAFPHSQNIDYDLSYNFCLRYGEIFTARYAYNVMGTFKLLVFSVFFYTLFANLKCGERNRAKSHTYYDLCQFPNFFMEPVNSISISQRLLNQRSLKHIKQSSLFHCTANSFRISPQFSSPTFRSCHLIHHIAHR